MLKSVDPFLTNSMNSLPNSKLIIIECMPRKVLHNYWKSFDLSTIQIRLKPKMELIDLGLTLCSKMMAYSISAIPTKAVLSVRKNLT